MKRIHLVFGDPDQGKTCLARELAANHLFVHLSVDDVYVQFVKEKWPELYFKALNVLIGPHYLWIQEWHDALRELLGRAFEAGWWPYLLSRIQAQSSRHDSVVAEGYILGFGWQTIMRQLAATAEVFPLKVCNKHYHYLQGEDQRQELSLAQIAALGTQ